MKTEGHKSPMPWLVWAHDPCPEGGWSIIEGFETQDEAVNFAKAHHTDEQKNLAHKEARFAERGQKVLFHCYSGVMVTPGEVFSLDLEAK